MKILFVLFALGCSLSVYSAGNYQEGSKKAVICSACHGDQGVSVNPVWPSLAGQHQAYLEKQLHDVKAGRRAAPLMAAMVATLSDQDITDLALFYSKQPLPKGVTSPSRFARGQALYRGGDFEKGITACIACHGPRGTGNAQAGFPALSGQQVEYTVLQMAHFKDHKRHNDINSIMQDISGRMSSKDMEAVANYVSGLH